MDGQAWRILAGAVATRVSLVLWGGLQLLQWRVEVSTPANSMRSVREGLALADLNVSPYSGSLCRAPPLVLWISQHTAAHEHLYVLPNLLLDVLTGLLLRDIATRVLPKGTASPNLIMAVFLLNPLTLAACIGGTTTCMECSAVLLAVWMAVRGSWLGSAAAVAVGAYVDLHWALLVMPATLLLLHGPDPCSPPQLDRQQAASPSGTGSSSGDTGWPRPVSGVRIVSCVVALTLLAMGAWLGLAALSNLVVQQLPGAPCTLSLVATPLTKAHPATSSARFTMSAAGQAGLDVQGVGARQAGRVVEGRCWAQAVYLLPLLVEDQTPNMGQTWYFFTEMFQQYLALFRFVVHSLSVVLLLPLALRFPRRPLLLFTAQCLITCMFKPYPSVGDHALYLALLPLLRPQLAAMRSGMLLTVGGLLLAVLEPAMWHMWINIESANSNFYYSISLLFGAWQTLLLVQLLLLTVDQERLHKQGLRARATGLQTPG